MSRTVPFREHTSIIVDASMIVLHFSEISIQMFSDSYDVIATDASKSSATTAIDLLYRRNNENEQRAFVYLGKLSQPGKPTLSLKLKLLDRPIRG